ncbi:MAG: type II secretion system F family protein [Planctomycetota bacterium]
MTSPILLSATTTALVVWLAASMCLGGKSTTECITSLERRRRRALEEGNAVYYFCGAFVRRLASWLTTRSTKTIAELEVLLGRQGGPLNWRPAEWLATTGIESAAFGLVAIAVWVGWLGGGVGAMTMMPLLAAFWGWRSWRRLRSQGNRRVAAIRVRLPFVIDSIGLSMEAGASFAESLELAADSCPGTEVGHELASIVSDVDRNQSMEVALEQLRTRLRDAMIDEFVMAGNTTYQLGAGVSHLMLDMSKRMRERRSHEVEAEAGRAQVKLYYPGIVLLVVGMMVVVGPYIFPLIGFLDGNP